MVVDPGFHPEPFCVGSCRSTQALLRGGEIPLGTPLTPLILVCSRQESGDLRAGRVKLSRLLQEAEIRLLETGKWQFCKARVTLTSVGGIITLDPAYAAIIGAQVEGYPTPISVMDFEFFPDGQGDIDVQGGSLRLIDQGLDGSDQRTYKLAGAEADDTIVAIVHKAPRVLMDPEIGDSSLPEDATENLICPDSGALKLCMLAIVMEENHDLGGSRDYMATCYARLNDREKTRRGNAQATPNVRPMGRGIRNIRNFK